MISRHKSWHVWNRDNLTRVRNDEAKHAEEVESKKVRQRELLNEQTLSILKKEAGDNGSTGDGRTNEAEGEGRVDTAKRKRRTMLELDQHFSDDEIDSEEDHGTKTTNGYALTRYASKITPCLIKDFRVPNRLTTYGKKITKNTPNAFPLLSPSPYSPSLSLSLSLSLFLSFSLSLSQITFQPFSPLSMSHEMQVFSL